MVTQPQKDDELSERATTLTVLRTVTPEDDDAWWVTEVTQALQEADAEDFATDAEMDALREKWPTQF